MLALLCGVAVVNLVRGRGPLALPDDVGPLELVAFVTTGSILQLIGGQPVSAAVVAVGNLTLLAILYLAITFGAASILGFTLRRLGKQLAAAVGLLARAVPLLLLFSMVLFVNTEMWQVFTGMDDPTYIAAAAVLASSAAGFVIVRLPREVIRLEALVGAEPRLSRRQRANVGLVLFVAQTLQVATVAAAIGAFFVGFGALAIGPEVIQSWLGTRGTPLVAFEASGVDVRVTDQLLRVAGGIAAMSGLYYSVALLTDEVYRTEFLQELTEDLQAVFAERERYLAGLR